LALTKIYASTTHFFWRQDITKSPMLKNLGFSWVDALIGQIRSSQRGDSLFDLKNAAISLIINKPKQPR
jgi:hypothetical protein